MSMRSIQSWLNKQKLYTRKYEIGHSLNIFLSTKGVTKNMSHISLGIVLLMGMNPSLSALTKRSIAKIVR